MANLPKEILAEKENVEESLKNLREAMSRSRKTVVELSAISAFLHNIYNGIENMIKQLLKIKKISVVHSQNWHKSLLDSAVKNGIISQVLCDELYEYLTFRHFFVHGYSFQLKEEPLEDLAVRIPGVWNKFLSEIKTIF